MHSRSVATGVVAAIAFNLVWENAQAGFYQGYIGLSQHFWVCAVASLGDIAIVAAIYLLIALAWRNPNWVRRASMGQYLVAICIGAIIAVTIEYWALRVGRWQYAAAMPLLPYTGIGLLPVLQMMIAPPLVFSIVRLAER